MFKINGKSYRKFVFWMNQLSLKFPTFNHSIERETLATHEGNRFYRKKQEEVARVRETFSKKIKRSGQAKRIIHRDYRGPILRQNFLPKKNGESVP